MCSLLVFRSTIDFCVFILYPVNLLNSLIISGSFSLDWNFLCRPSCHLQIGVLFFLFDLHIFISFSCIMPLAKTSSTMLNNHGGSGHLRFVLSLMGETFSLLLLNMMLAIGLMFCFYRYLSSWEKGYIDRMDRWRSILNFLEDFNK